MSVRLSGPPTAFSAPRGRSGVGSRNGSDSRPGTRSRIDAATLRSQARRVLRELGHARSELSLSLVDDDEMAEINLRYRGIDGPTDVLSFSLVEGECAEHRGRMLGDVVISIETAARQARERHRALDKEVTRLLIHGVLHLLGHDHEEPSDAKVMRAEERRIWRDLPG
jgi:probable rRNA maturation factor